MCTISLVAKPDQVVPVGFITLIKKISSFNFQVKCRVDSIAALNGKIPPLSCKKIYTHANNTGTSSAFARAAVDTVNKSACALALLLSCHSVSLFLHKIRLNKAA
ncbi:unnamed protein product [Pseudo-nitzschia multistriata]|uniref:Uncharacterized protein n=1 Tax=Pseudo-nitzschia multistriata TaxID=183589 RepID=A0A448ZGH7_9STRA|nr:unnamed protein product [Pseudo-nitzschia multistriata]